MFADWVTVEAKDYSGNRSVVSANSCRSESSKVDVRAGTKDP